jgi:uncharacterized membrane protein
MRAHRAETIGRPAAELYAMWRDFQNLPRFMALVESVTPAGDGRTRWVAKMPRDREMEWEVEVTEERDNELIAWQSVSGPIEMMGKVRFQEAPPGRGTEVHLTLELTPPGGVIGEKIAGLFDEVTAETLQNEIRRFRQLVETGEVATTDGQPSGRADDDKK